MTGPETGATGDVAALSGAEARALIGSRAWRRPTSGMAAGFVQANLVVLRTRQADDFREFCRLNPQPCPLLDVTEPGSPEPRRVAPGADLRVDVGRYRIYRHGRVTGEIDNLTDLWQPDFVAFLLGCSFTFETALLRGGIRLRHLEMGRNVAMYRTNRPCVPAGPFRGPLVVSMRPIANDLVQRAIDLTGQFPAAHGAPVHAGAGAALGIDDLARPDYGDSVPIRDGETPVFWACGVTPQAAAEAAAIDLMLSHAPGHMFITDMCDDDLRDASIERPQADRPQSEAVRQQGAGGS